LESGDGCLSLLLELTLKLRDGLCGGLSDRLNLTIRRRVHLLSLLAQGLRQTLGIFFLGGLTYGGELGLCQAGQLLFALLDCLVGVLHFLAQCRQRYLGLLLKLKRPAPCQFTRDSL